MDDSTAQGDTGSPAMITDTPRDPDQAERRPLMDALREGTRALHGEAERSGIVCDLLQGRADRAGYVMLLRNLLPAYRELELGLEHHRHSPGMRGIALPTVFRAAALESDLTALHGPRWEEDLSVLASATRYAALIAAAAQGDGTRLLAHAYVRYLGDLSGGQVLRRLLTRSLALAPHQLRFYEFAGVANLPEFKDGYRRALERAAGAVADEAALIAEAEAAFRCNIELSIAVREAARS
ncbi:MAG: biliverdin-producing heme oxygenase [Betaproteobacteria bacterium]